MKCSLFIILLFFSASAVAQEFDCEVTLNTQMLTTESIENLTDFTQQVKQYFNHYRWTKEDFGDEKIKVNIDIHIQGSPSTNRYVAKAFIGSQRPIRKLNSSTAVLRILDEKWEFDYVRNQLLTHETFQFDPLLNFLDYYAYIILGFDFESWNIEGGTPYFQKALEIVNRARSAPGAGKGWESATHGTYTRAQLVEELLNPKFKNFREAFSKYHYKGLDLLHKNPLKAKDNIASAILNIGKLQQKINTRPLIVKLFFDAKYLELAQLFVDYPNGSIYDKLAKIDPSHQKTYLEYKLKR